MWFWDMLDPTNGEYTMSQTCAWLRYRVDMFALLEGSRWHIILGPLKMVNVPMVFWKMLVGSSLCIWWIAIGTDVLPTYICRGNQWFSPHVFVFFPRHPVVVVNVRTKKIVGQHLSMTQHHYNDGWPGWGLFCISDEGWDPLLCWLLPTVGHGVLRQSQHCPCVVGWLVICFLDV